MSAARYAVRVARRGLATAAVHPTTASAASSAPRAAVPLANLEAQWERMNSEDQVAVHEQLEELQKKNWKELSLAEKKAGMFAFPFISYRRKHSARLIAYYVSFGPHGPRAPINPPGTTLKVVLGVTGLLAATGVIWVTTRSLGTSRAPAARVRQLVAHFVPPSTPSAQDHVEGVAGGVERARQGDAHQPYPRYVAFSVDYLDLAHSLVQVSLPRATRARVS